MNAGKIDIENIFTGVAALADIMNKSKQQMKA